jgi:hypothetical protein
MVARAILSLLIALELCAQVAKQIHVEYRKNDRGTYTSYIRNNHGAPTTAYIAQSTYRFKGQQQPSAWGGDTLAYPQGGNEVPPHQEIESNGLQPGAEPLTCGIMAVIYADGFSEGDEDVVQMLLSGRHRSTVDLAQVIPWLKQTAAGTMDGAALLQQLEALRKKDMAEAAQLDDLIDVPGVKHQYFMSAVPGNALQFFKSMKSPEEVRGLAGVLASQYEQWLGALKASKPPV